MMLDVMSPTPRVTVAIVSYRHEPYIVQALSTTLDQEDCNLIIADDCSPDGTQQLIRRWHEELPDETRARVTLILHEENRGLPATLNEALALVSTRYFAYLAGDDWHCEGRLHRQADFMDASGVALSYGEALRADAQGADLGQTFYERHPGWAAHIDCEDPYATMLWEGNWIAAPTVMFRTEVLRKIGGFDENIVFEDHDSYTRIAAAHTLGFLAGPPLAVHRELSDSFGSTLIRSDNLQWVEGQARMGLKHLGARDSLSKAMSQRAFVHVAQAAKLGADPTWVIESLSTLAPFMPPPLPWGWHKTLLRARWDRLTRRKTAPRR